VLVVEVFCGPLPVAAAETDVAGVNPVIDVDNCSASRQVLSTECRVTCLPGFQLRHLANKYICQYDGRAVWQPTTPPACYGSSVLHTLLYNCAEFGPDPLKTVAMHKEQRKETDTNRHPLTHTRQIRLYNKKLCFERRIMLIV